MTLWCMWYDANMQIVRIKNQWNRRKRFVECAAINCNFSHIKSKTKNWKKYLLDEMKYVVYTSDAFTELLYWSFDLFFFSRCFVWMFFFQLFVPNTSFCSFTPRQREYILFSIYLFREFLFNGFRAFIHYTV